MTQIIPAILATSKEQFKKNLDKIQTSPSLEEGWLHIDFADGEFVNNKTVDASTLKDNPTNLNIEAHLMVKFPGKWSEELVNLGVKRIIIHIESDGESIAEVISFCKTHHIEFGMAINMDTPLEKLDDYWAIIDLVQVMSITPGFQAQPFIDGALDRIKEIKNLRDSKHLNFLIGVDGHIDDLNVREILGSGADNLVIGSFLLTGDIEENVEKIWEKINS